MSSPGNQRHQKANTGGPSNVRDRRSRLFDDVLVKYEKLALKKEPGVKVAEMLGPTKARLRGLLLQVVRRPGGIMAGVRRSYLELRGWMILPWLFLRSYKCGLGVHCSPLP
ncbi:hypothetical protein ACOSQ4_006882 [Xanthoceras sorbifolium]